jgi:peptide/nickel transport system substrate-binding protein
MRKYLRSALTGVVAVGSVVALAACGSSSTTPSPGASGTGTGAAPAGAVKSGGTATIDSGTAPLSADQGLDFTTQGDELYSVVNTPLMVFKRGVQGTGGSQLLPGLAKAPPTITNGGKTLTFQLRPGLKYSNGQPVKASDETYALERDLKIPWQAASFISAFIVGADAYAKGKAKTISGITTNDSTGTITVHLMAPFAPMVDIFGLAGTAPVPKSTPMKNLAATGTIGDGPYKWGAISPGHTYTLIKNTSFSGVPNVPAGHLDKIVFNVNDNVLADAQSVLNNTADIFDPGDTLPASILQSVKTQAVGRYQPIPTNSTFYFFFAVNKAPFSNLWARKAVLAALDLRALSRLDSGFLVEDCHLIPFGIPGHSSPSSCTSLLGHPADGAPNMTLAKADMKKCGCTGAPVTVWGEERSPRKQYVDYYASVLNAVGFKATEKIINSGVYFTTIGAPSTHPQTGFGDWVQDFPNPWDFMQLFTGTAGSSLNYGYVNDSHYNTMVNKLDQQDATNPSVASQWSALDNYAVAKAYYAAYGHEEFPKFYSNRLNFNAGVYSVEYGTDLTSLALK